MDRQHMVACGGHVDAARSLLVVIDGLVDDPGVRAIIAQASSRLDHAMNLLTLPSSEAARKRAERQRKHEKAMASDAPAPPSTAVAVPTSAPATGVTDGRGRSRTREDEPARVYRMTDDPIDVLSRALEKT